MNAPLKPGAFSVGAGFLPVPAPIIRFEQVGKSLSRAQRPERGRGAFRHRSRRAARRDRRRHRPLRRRQVDADPAGQRAGARRPRAASWSTGEDVTGLTEARLARAPPPDRHDLPAFQPALLAHRLRQCRAAAGDRGRAEGARSRPRSSRCSIWSASPTSATAIRPNCPAARSSASASPARSRPSRRCCSATRRPRRSTPRRRSRSWRLLRKVNRELGLTILLITHEMSGHQGDLRPRRGDRGRAHRRGGRDLRRLHPAAASDHARASSRRSPASSCRLISPSRIRAEAGAGRRRCAAHHLHRRERRPRR